MKKVMIGILILIPVLILVIIAAVSSILKMAAWIAVDDISVVYKNTSTEAESINDIEFSGTPVDGRFGDFVTVKESGGVVVPPVEEPENPIAPSMSEGEQAVFFEAPTAGPA